MKQGDVNLLKDPVAVELLRSAIPARLAYTWLDGTPRVVPIWFTYTGGQFVLGSPPRAPKLKALGKHPKVALTIDNNEFPHSVLLVRGTAAVSMMDGVVPEYAASAERYFGEEQGKAWVENLGAMGLTQMARIAITPDWVGILDFKSRFPSAISA